MEGSELITEDTIILEIIRKYPESVKVFAKYGLKCLGWGGVAYESVGQAARVHGISAESLLGDLQQLEKSPV